MSRLIEKPERLCFYFCGLNISILSGLIAGLAGRLLGPRRGALAVGAGYTLLRNDPKSVLT
jgi:hypothetical protein